MKRQALYAATLFAVAGLGVSATVAAQAARGDATPRVQHDADRDGSISRAEAAKSPKLAARFDSLDRNRDGVLDRSERPRHHGRRGGGRRGHGGLERLDSDGDGRISRAEFDARKPADRAHRAGGKPGATLAFAQLDANRDGYLVRTELAAWEARMRPQREAAMAKRFEERFVAADLNRDGKLSKVEVGEKMPPLAARFAWMDDNRDGFLSRAELKPARR